MIIGFQFTLLFLYNTFLLHTFVLMYDRGGWKVSFCSFSKNIKYFFFFFFFFIYSKPTSIHYCHLRGSFCIPSENNDVLIYTWNRSHPGLKFVSSEPFFFSSGNKVDGTGGWGWGRGVWKQQSETETKSSILDRNTNNCVHCWFILWGTK